MEHTGFAKQGRFADSHSPARHKRNKLYSPPVARLSHFKKNSVCDKPYGLDPQASEFVPQQRFQSFDQPFEFKLNAVRKDTRLRSRATRYARRTAPRTLQVDYSESSPVKGDRLAGLLGRVGQAAMTQQGSRFVQSTIEKASVEDLELVLAEILPDLADLMTHPYANYMCSTLFRCVPPDQRLLIVREVSGSLQQIATDKFGTHCLQTLVDLASLPAEEQVYVNMLRFNLYQLAANEYATHIVQKIIQNVTLDKRAQIIEQVLQKFKVLVNDKFGLCVVKKCVQMAEGAQREHLLRLLTLNTIELVQSPYGNYAVQFAIQEWGCEYTIPILDQILERFAQLSIQKFASNVIERCLESSPELLRKDYVWKMCKEESVKVMLSSKFSLYVVRKALEQGSYQEREEILDAFGRYVPDMADKKMKPLWEQLVDESWF